MRLSSLSQQTQPVAVLLYNTFFAVQAVFTDMGTTTGLYFHINSNRIEVILHCAYTSTHMHMHMDCELACLSSCWTESADVLGFVPSGQPVAFSHHVL